jgi:hypothetical protein
MLRLIASDDGLFSRSGDAFSGDAFSGDRTIESTETKTWRVRIDRVINRENFTH